MKLYKVNFQQDTLLVLVNDGDTIYEALRNESDLFVKVGDRICYDDSEYGGSRWLCDIKDITPNGSSVIIWDDSPKVEVKA